MSAPTPPRKTWPYVEPTLVYSPARLLLEELLRSSVIHAGDWEALLPALRQELADLSDVSALLARLVESKLLTEYQASRIAAGRAADLILGSYRLLDRLGQGSMSEIFRAEHLRLRRPVAVKVFRPPPGEGRRLSDGIGEASLPKPHPSQLLRRFFTEMWAVGQLQHPNIVTAFDAGEAQAPVADDPPLHYLVTEYVPGRDLEALVEAKGPLEPVGACTVAYQVAAALAAAHQFGLVHRDIKPSNVILTPEGQAKLLDFGVARGYGHHYTEPGTVLGTVSYMAPEQAQDASAVDIRADLYGLGGILYWCLTGQPPFPAQGSPLEDLARRHTLSPPRAREICPNLPPRLDEVLARLLAPSRNDRYPDPQAVQRALAPFVAAALPGTMSATALTPPDIGWQWGGFPPHTPPFTSPALAPALTRLALVVDDEEGVRGVCQLALDGVGVHCDEAGTGREGMEAIRKRRYDLVLLDVGLPTLTGPEVLRRLREDPPYPNLKVIMMSGQASGDEMSALLAAGADDYLTKPLSVVELRHRVGAALRLKGAQDRSDLLLGHLHATNLELEQSLQARDCDLIHARNALVLALAELAGHREMGAGARLLRLQRYCRCLAEEAAVSPGFAGQVDNGFVGLLECCAPLYDIGKAGIPDYIRLKPGPLTAEERAVMETHTVVGAETLRKVARKHSFARPFFQMAVEVTRHHHERWDGTGYPDRLAGDTIPLAARFVAIADVYDALRSRQAYRPALPHDATVRVMAQESPGHFDPALLQIFQRCAHHLDHIFRTVVE